MKVESAVRNAAASSELTCHGELSVGALVVQGVVPFVAIGRVGGPLQLPNKPLNGKPPMSLKGDVLCNSVLANGFDAETRNA